VERRVEWTPGTSKAIVAALRNRVRTAAGRHGDRIVEHAGQNWTAWRSGKRNRVFAELRPLRGRIQVFILPRPSELRNGKDLARAAPRTQGWGWFRSRLEVPSMTSVEAAARLIVQSYERVIQGENGGRRRPNGRRTQAL
jgi:hypothetical protein